MHATFCSKNLKGKHRGLCDDNIKMDPEIRHEGLDWSQLTQDRDQWQALVNTVVKLRVLQKMENFLTRRAIICF